MRDYTLILQNITMIRERIELNPDMGPRERLAGKVMINTLQWALDYKRKTVKTPKQVMRDMNRLDYKHGDAL